tara:strand:+ start:888 stop:2918 length:2031 start_codon:yes stop_codon:yes gene_type:complete
MSLIKLNIPGGTVSDRSDYSSGPVWKSTEKVRFQQGLPEKIGGWTSEVNWSFTGTPSDVLAWQTLGGDSVIAVGTNKKLQIVVNDSLTDITPANSSVTLNGAFDMVDESAIVTVHDVAHGAEDGDYVVFSGATAGGGITVTGEYILTFVDANTYTIQHPSAATSTATGQGGSSIATVYLLGTGNSVGTAGLGWGAGTWGTPRTGTTPVTDTITGITAANPGVVTAGNHPFSNGDLVRITDVVGMVELNGNSYTVANKATNTFQLSGTNTSAFTSYGSAGTATKLFGWGFGVTASESNVTLEADLWSLSLWGEDLIATRRNGKSYLWDATTPTTRAAVISNAPTISKLSLVSVPDRHMVCFGATPDNTAEDPLLVRWSDQEDFTTWTPAAANTAGSQRLQQGSKIVAAVQTRDQILVFTDDALYGMQFQGPPFTFSFRILGTGGAPLSQNSVANVNGTVYWMGSEHFYLYDGSVKVLPSPVRDHVFDSMENTLDDSVYSGINRSFTEIWWFYTADGGTSANRYVCVNYKTNEWHFGSLDRSVWLDDSSWLTSPIAINSNGTLYYHENGFDDDGAAITSSVESGAFEIPETGDKLLLVDRMIPDSTVSGNLSVTLFVSKYPGGTETTKGPFPLTENTEKISLRGRGRQFRIKVESTGIQDYWKWGIPRVEIKSDGKGF